MKSPTLLLSHPKPVFCATLVIGLCLASSAGAQSGGAVVNQDVLQSLSDTTTEPSEGAPALLPPPAERPRSQLLVAPVRKPEPPKAAEAPAPDSEPVDEAPSETSTAQSDAAAPPAPSADETSGSAGFVASPNLGPGFLNPTTANPPATPPAPAPPADTAQTAVPAPPGPEADAENDPSADLSPEPEVATPAPPAEPATQTAATPPSEPVLAEPLQILFPTGSDQLGSEAEAVLGDLAPDLVAAPNQRFQLRAFADKGDGSDGQARRLSLARARAVRSYLMDHGVPSSQIDVRALGNNYESGPADRVDIVYTGG